MSLNVVIKSS